jgi:predicted RNA binding protein YcfA (HicA-like mRNA interferase family)
VVRLLKSQGWVLVRQGRGSHEIWGDPDSGGRLSIPANEEISAGIIRQIVAEFPDAPDRWR